MRFSKSLKPPALSNYLLVDKNHNLHLAIPLIGGAYIGTDNTCQTAKALKQFFGADPTHTNTATHQLDEYKKQLELQLSRECRPLPTMKLNPEIKNIFDFKFEDFTLEGYDPHPHIKGVVAV